MSKMYYTAEEAAAKLGVSAEELEQMVRDEQLRVFKDGQRNMYMATEVDAQAPPTAQGEEEEVELTPAAAPAGEAGGSEDFTITSQGISIFDEEDLEIESADPSAKTQIAPSIEDQIAVEGVGSGSGLLDLTRESDDTSLGEVIDNIELDEPTGEEGSLAGAVAGYGEAAGGQETVMVVQAPAGAMDAGSGLCSGLAVGSAILVLVFGALALAVGAGASPSYLTVLQKNLLAVLGGAAVLVIVFGVIGLLIGKSVAGKGQAT